jgi:site-specific recombinase XerD
MHQFIERYAQVRLAHHARPATVEKLRNAGKHLADWLAAHHPELESFAELTREQVLAYGASIVSAGTNMETQITRLSSLSVMFHDATAWGWPEAPPRPLIGARDLPKRPNRIPRFIPAEELDRLFESALQTACERAGLVDPEGRARITAHRFRHTVGTELVEGGARLHTVMKMLGHTSTGMTLVYAHLSDATLREEYLKVLGPGAQIAGPLAAILRAGAMPPDSIAWLKANFFRTELELGHCLRLPEEGPCECDLYLTCAKFVTTPEYAPRLRERREREIALAEEARKRGFTREEERHECTRQRIEQLLAELGEAIDSSP